MITLKCFDAREASENQQNRYIYLNIRSWLNSTATAGKWYIPQHSGDIPPNNSNVIDGNGYEAEAGFLYNFSASMRNSLLYTSITVSKVTPESRGTETCEDRVFLASCTEMGLSGDYICGTRFPPFNSDVSRQAYPTSECVSKSEYTNRGLNASETWFYWLRDGCKGYGYEARCIYLKGDLGNYNPGVGKLGVRPFCNLSSEILVSDTADSDGAYTFVWNRPPSTPPNIDVPTTVRGGESLTVSWGSSTDADSNLSGYILERQYNGSAWTLLYKGINRAFTDSITFGWNSVAYRMKAYDSAGAESAYQTSATRTVINNTPPTISGNDEDLGLKTGAFNVSYTVTDADSGQTITVVEKIDGADKRKFTATNGQNYSFNVTAEEWIKLLNGTHTMTITATDNYGGTTTRTYTFTKNETEIELTLATPLPADDLVTKAIMSVTRQIPPGAAFSVEVCNNGNDASLTWEDVTNAVLRNSKFFLTNTTKTAAAWGFNFRIKVNRNNATGDCFIVSAGGNFE